MGVTPPFLWYTTSQPRNRLRKKRAHVEGPLRFAARRIRLFVVLYVLQRNRLLPEPLTDNCRAIGPEAAGKFLRWYTAAVSVRPLRRVPPLLSCFPYLGAARVARKPAAPRSRVMFPSSIGPGSSPASHPTVALDATEVIASMRSVPPLARTPVLSGRLAQVFIARIRALRVRVPSRLVPPIVTIAWRGRLTP